MTSNEADRPVHESKEEIEVTPAMIEAGATVLWDRADIDIGPTGCEILAQKILVAALKVARR